MTSTTRKFRISPAMILSIVALFVALGGSAYAVGIGKNTVRSPQIVDGAVRTVDVRDNAVNAAKVAPDAIGNEELADNSVTSQQVVDETLTNADLGAASITSSEIADGSVGSADVSDNSLTANDLAADSVRASELGTIVQRQSTVEGIAAGANGSVTVTCAAGEQIISGGGQPGNFGVEMTSSRPSGNGWLYQAKNNNGSASTIAAFALCLAN
jgi:hypothetical protein